jgi:hypothetical protein
MNALLDARGCLTAAGFAAVAAAPVGKVPPELANHLATCGRCQQRLLAGGVDPATRPPRKPAPSLGRMFLVLALVVLSILAFLLSLRWLTAR